MPSTDLPPAIHVDEPRAFGHFIGDVLTRHIEVTVPLPYALAEGRLPQRGRIGRLELEDAAVGATRIANTTRYRIDLVYQIVDSPLAPEIAPMPPVALRFAGGGRSFEQEINPWPIAMAPLAPSGIRTAFPALRPARAPTAIDATATRLSLVLCGALSAVLFAHLVLARIVLPRLAGRRGPFATALLTLRTLAASAPSVARRQAALRAVHRAFDATVGFRVFAARLEEFFALHPEFLEMRDAAKNFFELSRQEFFGPGGADGEGAGGAQSNGPGGADDNRALDALMTLTAQFKARESRARARAQARVRAGASREARESEARENGARESGARESGGRKIKAAPAAGAHQARVSASRGEGRA
jgi:mxaA protein